MGYKNYREFSVTQKRIFHYQFTCEHCGKTTDWTEGVVYGTGKLATPMYTTSLTAEQTSDLEKQAVEKMNERYEYIKRCADIGNYAGIRTDKDDQELIKGFGDCPFCGTRQSWSKSFTFWEIIFIVLCEAVIWGSMNIWSKWLPNPESAILSILVFLLGIFVPLIVGLLMGLALAKIPNDIYAKKHYIGGKCGKPELRFWES
jgi:transcription elongation factor Elf1